jgi:hypothetical protein
MQYRSIIVGDDERCDRLLLKYPNEKTKKRTQNDDDYKEEDDTCVLRSSGPLPASQRREIDTALAISREHDVPTNRQCVGAKDATTTAARFAAVRCGEEFGSARPHGSASRRVASAPSTAVPNLDRSI